MDINVIIGVGSKTYSPNQIMSLNETGAFLWKLLEAGAEKGDLIENLIKEYDIDRQIASKDVSLFLSQLQEKALVTE